MVRLMVRYGHPYPVPVHDFYTFLVRVVRPFYLMQNRRLTFHHHTGQGIVVLMENNADAIVRGDMWFIYIFHFAPLSYLNWMMKITIMTTEFLGKLPISRCLILFSFSNLFFD